MVTLEADLGGVDWDDSSSGRMRVTKISREIASQATTMVQMRDDARVSTSTDGSSTRPRTARTAWVGASHCTTWYASRGNQYRTGTSSTLLKSGEYRWFWLIWGLYFLKVTYC